MALKYISNVTYGYTSASFSGRMPNVDIADAIVLSGRKTLERAVDIIESNSEWEAKVVYGDTDRSIIWYNTVFLSFLVFLFYFLVVHATKPSKLGKKWRIL